MLCIARHHGFAAPAPIPHDADADADAKSREQWVIPIGSPEVSLPSLARLNAPTTYLKRTTHDAVSLLLERCRAIVGIYLQLFSKSSNS